MIRSLPPDCANLLPKSLQWILLDKEKSPLRNPIDYYDNKYEIDAHG